MIKPIRDCDEVEMCRQCHQVMQKDYAAPGWGRVGVVVFKGHFNASLGRYIGSQRDITDAQNKIQDETGSRPIELGNEKPKAAPKTQSVDMREVMDYAAKLQTDRGETVNNG